MSINRKLIWMLIFHRSFLSAETFALYFLLVVDELHRSSNTQQKTILSVYHLALLTALLQKMNGLSVERVKFSALNYLRYPLFNYTKNLGGNRLKVLLYFRLIQKMLINEYCLSEIVKFVQGGKFNELKLINNFFKDLIERTQKRSKTINCDQIEISFRDYNLLGYCHNNWIECANCREHDRIQLNIIIKMYMNRNVKIYKNNFVTCGKRGYAAEGTDEKKYRNKVISLAKHLKNYCAQKIIIEIDYHMHYSCMDYIRGIFFNS